jgi:hypothetical protein
MMTSSQARSDIIVINAIQFQKGLSMAEFIEQYGTEAKCYRALYRSRWPKGFRCPACNDRARSRFRRDSRVYYQCCACRHQTTLISGTLFEGTKLPLRSWFLALYLLTSTKTNLSALELKRHLGVRYRTAWRLKHKVMQAMMEREESRRLTGFVQVDDAYLGVERNGGKVGRGSENKQPFMIAISTNAELEHPTFAVIEPVKGFDNASIADWSRRRLAPNAEVYSDGLACFRRCRSSAYGVGDAGWPRRHGSERRALGQRVAGQRQTRHQWALSRVEADHLRAALSG